MAGVGIGIRGGGAKSAVTIGRRVAIDSIEINVADLTGRREVKIWGHSGDTVVSFERKGTVRSVGRL